MTALAQRLQQLDAALAGEADPRRLAALVPAGLTPESWAALGASPRLSARLAAWLRRHLALGPCPPALLEKPEHRLLLLDRAALSRIPAFAGALWHARALRSVLQGEARARIVAAIGEDALAFGLRETRHAAGPDGQASDLAEALRRDGALCLVAWLESAPREVGLRLRLRLPAAVDLGGTPDAAHRQHAGPILARVAARLAADG